MQKITNTTNIRKFKTANTTNFKSEVLTKKRSKIKFFANHDPIGFPVNAKDLFNALGLDAKKGTVTQLKSRGFSYGQDFVTVRREGNHTETYMTTWAARNLCARRRDKIVGSSVAQRIEGVLGDVAFSTDIFNAVEAIRKCVEDLRGENDSLKKELAEANERVSVLESKGNDRVVHALMKIISGAA